MKRDEFLQVIRSPFHFATCDAVLRGCKIVDISKPPQWRRLSKKVRSPLDPLCEGTPPAGGGGENCTAARNISGYGKVLSLRPFGAPLPLWRKRHLPRIGGVCLAEGGKDYATSIPKGRFPSCRLHRKNIRRWSAIRCCLPSPTSAPSCSASSSARI